MSDLQIATRSDTYFNCCAERSALDKVQRAKSNGVCCLVWESRGRIGINIAVCERTPVYQDEISGLLFCEEHVENARRNAEREGIEIKLVKLGDVAKAS